MKSVISNLYFEIMIIILQVQDIKYSFFLNVKIHKYWIPVYERPDSVRICTESEPRNPLPILYRNYLLFNKPLNNYFSI